MRFFNALVVDDPDVEWLFIGGSYLKAHQDSTGGVATEKIEAIGKSCVGNTSKIHMAVNAYGFPYAFRITGGEVHDSTEARALTACWQVILWSLTKTMPLSASVSRLRHKMEALIPRRCNSKREKKPEQRVISLSGSCREHVDPVQTVSRHSDTVR